jgi:hypothetical protein
MVCIRPIDYLSVWQALSGQQRSPDAITEGTIAYGFTFDTGFKLVWLDSAGPVTDRRAGVSTEARAGAYRYQHSL